MNILSSIKSPSDLKALDNSQLLQLCGEIRGFLIENISKTGGHLASNLGIVELTVAIHRVYNTSKDRVIFDVGHQSYVHKLLTGRMDDFSTLRCLDGLSGYPKPSESIHDAAVSGHASNSISVATGMARARTLMREDYSVAALIGDGAMTGGLAFEGMSSAADSGEPIVVILNDNGMAIDDNVGGMASLISKLHLKPEYLDFKRRYRHTVGKVKPLYNFNHRLKEWVKKRMLPHSMFEDLGFLYLGPVDGHDIEQTEAVLTWAKEQTCPTLVHVITQKGKGYSFAEDKPEVYHGVEAFDFDTGLEKGKHLCFSYAFGEALCDLSEKDEQICAITAAMCSGTGLSSFAAKFKSRFFDVGITEGNAVAMSAGMSKQGLIPVFAVYSTFLQRSYDMLIHDISLSNLHLVLAVDRAGIVGRDGATHQGVFDVAYLSSIPGMTIYCPSSYAELKDMLSLAIYNTAGPVAIRYPRGTEGEFSNSTASESCCILRNGSDISIASYGIMINNALAAANILEQQGISAEVIKINIIKPLDCARIIASANKTGILITVEDVCAQGSVGMNIFAAVAEAGIKLKASAALDLGDGIVPQGTVAELEERFGIDSASIARKAVELIGLPDIERLSDEKSQT